MASLNWNPSQSNPSSTSQSAIQSNPQSYPAPQFRNVEYAANPYASMPSYHQHMSSDSLSSSQMPSSIGPSRSNARSTGIVTRRKAAQMAAVQGGHVRDNSLDGQRPPNSLGYMHGSASRPHTPGEYAIPNSYQHPQHQNTELPPLSLPAGGMHPNSGSPQYPSTPASVSPYSPYSFFAAHSRSNSGSTTNPRSASPALSIASALTSVSSSTNSFGNPQTPGNANMSPVVRKHKKQRLFNLDRKDICLYHKENPNARQEDIAIKYGVERSTISKILKHKQKWMNVPEDEELKVAKHRPSKFPEIEAELVEWLGTFTSSNSTTLSDSLIRAKAKEVAKNLRISEEKFKASSGWVENFKHRHGIRRGVWYGEGKPTKPLTSVPIPSSNVPDQRGGMLPSFNSSFSNNGSGEFRDSPMEDDGYRNRLSMSLRPPWNSDRSPILESATTKINSDNSYAHPDAPTSAVSMHSSSMSLRSAWEPTPSPLERSSTYEHHHQHNDSPTGPSSNPHTLPPIHPYASESSPSTDGPYTGMAVYDNMPPVYRPDVQEVPDITEAENAVDKVIRFIEAQPSGFITAGEKDALTQIKYALFQSAGGTHYPKEKR